jgi:hypothetical protein
MSRNCNHKTCEGSTCRRPAKPKPKRKPIKRVSKKRGREERKYSVLRKQFLEEGDECEAKLPGCTFFATELHHPVGKIASRLTDLKKCKKLCRNCHQWAELNPEKAKHLGLSESRLTLIQKP